MIWPLPFSNVPDYHKVSGRQHNRWFGALREGRAHAACDLMAPLGTDVYAIADGVVEDVARTFKPFLMVGVIAIRHGLFTIRYCEVIPESIFWAQKGALVKEGQVIAKVGRMNKLSMLHFEQYAGTVNGPLSNTKNPPFMRRSDLMDPTPLLDQLRGRIRAAEPSQATTAAGK